MQPLNRHSLGLLRNIPPHERQLNLMEHQRFQCLHNRGKVPLVSVEFVWVRCPQP